MILHLLPSLVFEQVTPSLGEGLSDGLNSLFQEDIFSSDHECNGSVIEVSRISAEGQCVHVRLLACVRVFNIHDNIPLFMYLYAGFGLLLCLPVHSANEQCCRGSSTTRPLQPIEQCYLH